MGLTDHGRAHCLRRLSAAQSVEELREIWGRLGVWAQRDNAVRSHKDKLKAMFEE